MYCFGSKRCVFIVYFEGQDFDRRTVGSSSSSSQQSGEEGSAAIFVDAIHLVIEVANELHAVMMETEGGGTGPAEYGPADSVLYVAW
jgi:hypothetical protein